MFSGGNPKNVSYYDVRMHQDFSPSYFRTYALSGAVFYLDDEVMTIKRYSFTLVDAL